jgi:ribosome-associated translation inhibitor RaiA
MKFLVGLLSFLIIVITSILYTPYVTNALKPYIEKEIEKRVGFDVTVTSLNLHVNSFDLQVLLTPKNHVDIDGTYSPFSKKLHATYTAKLENIKALQEHINYELHGSATITGKLIYQPNIFKLDAHSNIFDGTVDATYQDDTIHATFSQLQSLKLLKMLQYPQAIRSDINGTLHYNMKLQNGKLTTQVNHAHLAPNPTMDLLKDLSEYNIYEAEFSGALQSQIDKEILISSMKLLSPNASITSNNIRLNRNDDNITANLHVIANQYPFDIKVSGDIKNPDVTLDTKEVLKNELGRYLNHLIKELF